MENGQRLPLHIYFIYRYSPELRLEFRKRYVGRTDREFKNLNIIQDQPVVVMQEKSPPTAPIHLPAPEDRADPFFKNPEYRKASSESEK